MKTQIDQDGAPLDQLTKERAAADVKGKDSDCYFEKNKYGFMQKRVREECLRIPPADAMRKIELDNILNCPLQGADGQKLYGYSTKYLAIDCEMDQVRATFDENMHQPNNGGGLMMYSLQSQNIPIKVSIVNQDGQIVLDTLIRPCVNGHDYDDAKAVPGYRSLVKIHGIKKHWLSDAPTFDQVRAHIQEICGKQEISQNEAVNGGVDLGGNYTRTFIPVSAQNFDAKQHSIFIGHGVVYDLKSMALGDVPYLCTSKIDEQCGQARKLKDLSSMHLNAEIQIGHHSSIIDARCSLALFILLRDSQCLEMYGPHFLNSEEVMTSLMSRRRRRNKMCTSDFMSVNVLDSHSLQPPPSTQQAQSSFPVQAMPVIPAQRLNYADEIEQMMRSMNMIECELTRLIVDEQRSSQPQCGSGAHPSLIAHDRSYQMDVNLLKCAIEQVCDEAIREMLKAY